MRLGRQHQAGHDERHGVRAGRGIDPAVDPAAADQPARQELARQPRMDHALDTLGRGGGADSAWVAATDAGAVRHG